VQKKIPKVGTTRPNQRSQILNPLIRFDPLAVQGSKIAIAGG